MVDKPWRKKDNRYGDGQENIREKTVNKKVGYRLKVFHGKTKQNIDTEALRGRGSISS